ncbi:MAG TPA: hypothetical protein VGO00_00575 [Kofleriaceae bacterium]|nr:hypothetical protein [Kofleriaceae bacterium]
MLHGTAVGEDGRPMPTTFGTSIQAAVGNAVFAERPVCWLHCTEIIERASLGSAGFLRITRTRLYPENPNPTPVISLVFGHDSQWWSAPVPFVEEAGCSAGHCDELEFAGLDVRRSRDGFVAMIRVRHARYTNEPPRTRVYNAWHVTVECKLDAAPRCTWLMDRE